MMECREILQIIEEIAPVSYACSWDNVGLLAGRRDKQVSRVTVALDADDRAIEQAVANGSELLVTHHPLIFSPMKRITDETLVGRRLVKLLSHDMCLISMHTNFDIAPGCMGDLAAQRLGLTGYTPLEVTGEGDNGPYGIGVVGSPAEGSVTVEELCFQVKEAFDLEGVQLYAPEDMGPVTCVAMCPGSGKDEISYALAAGAQVLITGDITYHYATDAVAEGLAIIDAGHYGLEQVFIPFMASYLKEQLPDLTVDAVKICQPSRFV